MKADDAYGYTNIMNRVMDGLCPTTQYMQRLVLPKPKLSTAVLTAPGTSVHAVGMDGIRRMTPYHPEELVQTQLPNFVTASGTLAVPIWQMPSLRMPNIGWKRPAIAFGLIATALVASTAAVSIIATPAITTARASTSAVHSASSKSLAPVPAAAAAVSTPTAQKNGLNQILSDFTAANPDKFGIVVKDMSTGESASIGSDRQIASASLYKLFIAQRIYQQIDLGQIDYGKAAGNDTGLNVADCLRIMINISDNECGRALGTILGWGAQDQALSIEGYKQTTLSSPQKTSADDIATLLNRLYAGTLISGNSSDKFMSLLKDQRVNNRLPVGLPAGTVIAHKTGDLEGVVHDAGIVYGPKTNYLVVVTSGPWNSPGNAPALFADLSAKLWNYFEN